MKTMRDGENALFIDAWHKVHNLSRRGDHGSFEDFVRSIETFGQQKRLLLFAIDCAFLIKEFAKSHTGVLMEAFTNSLGFPVSNVYVRILDPDGSEVRYKHEQPRATRQWLRDPTSKSIGMKNNSAQLYDMNQLEGGE